MIYDQKVKVIPELSYNHEEAVTKLVALLKSANLQN